MKKILILNSFIKKYTGSEIMTLELARTFKELGYSVYVAAFDIGFPLIEEFNNLSINVRNLHTLDHNDHYDLIWAHHFITLEYCLLDKKITSDKVIFSSLSPFTPLECPPFILDKVSVFLANSIETKEKLVSMGISENSITLFPNPVPAYFFQQKKQFSNSKVLKNIAIISNHIPEELLLFSKESKKHDLNVELIGIGFKEILVTPELLLNYDAVITIGKTAQYCLSLGIPVYCYDIFGGSGWITTQNIAKLGKYNFSGRDSNLKKDFSKIISEIKDYRIDLVELEKLAKWAKSHYNMENLVISIANLSKITSQENLKDDKLYKIIERQRKFYLDNIFGDDFSQLFFKINGKFSEGNSIREKIKHDSIVNVAFNLNFDVSEFRFDFSNKPALVSELVISLHYTDGEIEYVKDYNFENIIFVKENRLLSLSNDPRIFFKKQKDKKLIRISIEYIVHSDFLYEEAYASYRFENEELNKNNIFLKDSLSSMDNKLHLLESDVEKYIIENNRLRDTIFSLEKEKLTILKDSKNKLNIKENTIREMNEKFNKDIEIKNEKINKLESMLLEIKGSRGYKMLVKIRNLVKNTDYKILKRSKYFNSRYYLSINSDVREANLDPIKHFLEHGWKEGRNPSKLFDINYYLQKYDDVRESNTNPLLHYIKYGKKERRSIQSVEMDRVTQIKNMIYLVKDNPILISKFLLLVKNKGIKYALLKAKNKANQKEDIEAEIDFYFDDEFQSLDKNYLLKISDFYAKNKISKPIDIIIPVYNGFEFFENLFDSLKRNTTLPYRLLIADDKSPDEKVVPFIENFINQNPDINIIFIKSKENKGFLKTVNLLAEYANNHFVLLNTDTEVPEYWLERLMYPIFSNNNIASTTPFTNSGTICSFPNYLNDNKDIYGNLTLEQVDHVFKYVNIEKTMLEVPTGVGFCMGVNFDVVKQIGMFDEIYGKGYGEENDWCQRAINAGYKNVHITNLFVYHKHGGSFLSEDKIRYINEHYKILLDKFPTYDEQIQKTIKENALSGLRSLVRTVIDFKYTTKENIFIIDHELGGGANLYRKQKIDNILSQGKGVILFSYNITKDKYYISFLANNFKQKFLLSEYSLLVELLDLLKVNEIFLNGLVSFPNVYKILSLILKMKEKSNAKLVFPVHDYFCISPSYTLLTENNRYSGVPSDLEEHSRFLKDSKAEFKLFCSEINAKNWQNEWKKFLLSCDEILCFSHSSEDICTAAYKDIKEKLIYIPHDIRGTFDKIYNKDELGKSRIIGILGNINLPKGSSVINGLVKYIDRHNLNIKVVLIGNIDIEIRSNSFIKTGNYKKADVPELIKKYAITEFLIPSIWPETYSYTTDEIMQLGYPITVFDLGAPAERVKLYEKGRIINLNSENYIEETCKQWL